MTWFRVILALAAVVVALSVASFAVRGYIDWHDERTSPTCQLWGDC